ncbi:MAG TPA: DUF59 domain-containing protein [Terriglobia bacterium]|nr:DUF59 domain-containing protein [Terriglobia bacterium]
MDDNPLKTLPTYTSPVAPKANETQPAPSAAEPALSGVEQVEVYDKVIETLRTCYDPEIPVNIYELGLIYEVKVDPSGAVTVKMTLTTPNCPAAQSLPIEVKQKTEAVPRVTEATVDVIWEPPWDPSKMTEAARLQLGMF